MKNIASDNGEDELPPSTSQLSEAQTTVGATTSGVEFAYDTARQTLARQQDQLAGVETQLGVLTGLVALAIGGYFQLASTPVDKYVSGFLLLLAIVSAALGFFSGRIFDAPNPATVAIQASLEAVDIKAELLGDLLTAIARNEVFMDRKRQWISLSLGWVGTLGLFIVVRVILGQYATWI